MAPLAPGSTAPPIPGLRFEDGPRILFFYKVTCPVCQMAAPAVDAFGRAYPGRIVGIGQDPPAKLASFSHEYGMDFRVTTDEPPYPVSSGFGIETVPTTFLIDGGGSILDVVESWDRDGLNRLSKHLAELTGSEYAEISHQGDGLPPFRPG
ncbi:MAG TPA: TlpA disulfide reductase family protein [Actinomycetota bacterium]